MASDNEQRRDEIVDIINAALEIVDEVAQDSDGDAVRAVIAGFALKQLSESDVEGSVEDDAPEEDEEEPDAVEEEPEDEADEEPAEASGEEPEPEAEEEPEEPEPPRRTRGRSASRKTSTSKKASSSSGRSGASRSSARKKSSGASGRSRAKKSSGS